MAEDAAGEEPEVPARAMTEDTGAAQRGCVAVAVRVDDEVRDCEALLVWVRVAELLGVPVRVAELLGVEVCEGAAVPLPVRDCEPLGVDVRVPEELGVPVPLGVADALRVLEALRVPDGEPDADRVEAGVCVALEVTVRGEALPVREDEAVPAELEAPDVRDEALVLVGEELAVWLGLGDGVPVKELDAVPEGDGERVDVAPLVVLALLDEDDVGAGDALRRLAMLRPR